MSENPTPSQTPPPAQSGLFSNPQVITAIVGGLVTVLVAFIGIVPQLAQNDPTPTPMIVTATPQPTTAVAVVPSNTPQPAAPSNTPESAAPGNTAPSNTPVPPTNTPEPVLPTNTPQSSAPSNPPNVRLFMDDASFTALNISGQRISLVGVTFTSSTGSFDVVGWANNNRFPAGNCLRIRDAAAGRRTPPAECGGNLLSLLEVGPTTLFWVGTGTFDVKRNGQTIATCATNTLTCDIYVPQ